MRVIDSFPLLYHELGHLWHFQRRTAPAWAENRSPQQLADLNPDEVYGMLAAL